MNANNASKKTVAEDWDTHAIVAALHRAGWSFRQLSLHHGYKSETSLRNALDRPYPKAQRLIAEAIGVTPESIWPSRYLRTNRRVRRPDSNGFVNTPVGGSTRTRNSSRRSPVGCVESSLDHSAACAPGI